MKHFVMQTCLVTFLLTLFGCQQNHTIPEKTSTEPDSLRKELISQLNAAVRLKNEAYFSHDADSLQIAHRILLPKLHAIRNIDMDYRFAWHHLIDTHFRLNQIDSVTHYAKKYAVHFPEDKTAFSGLALMLYLGDDHETAKILAEKSNNLYSSAIDTAGDPTVLMINQAMPLVLLGRMDEALAGVNLYLTEHAGLDTNETFVARMMKDLLDKSASTDEFVKAFSE